MPKALQIPLKPSKVWLAFLFALHLLAVFSIAYSSLSITLTVSLLALLLLHFAYQVKIWLSPVVRTICHDENGFSVMLAGESETAPVQLLSSSKLNPFFSLLRFQSDQPVLVKRHYTVILCPDSTDPQLLRQLRVLLHSGRSLNMTQS